MKRLNFTFFALAIALFSNSAFADECGSVKLAFEEKRYSTALRYAEPLLKKGEACAQYYKGVMVLRGYGVKMDVHAGIAMIELAASKGYQKAIEFVDSYY